MSEDLLYVTGNIVGIHGAVGLNKNNLVMLDLILKNADLLKPSI